VLCGASISSGRNDVEFFQILHKGALIFERESGEIHFISNTSSNDFVVNVSEIAHVVDIEAKIQQDSFEYIIGQKGSEVSDMSRVIDGGTTGVHFHRVFFHWLKGLILSSFKIE
jgi:protein gp37